MADLVNHTRAGSPRPSPVRRHAVIRDIEVLRAFAVLFTVFQHLPVLLSATATQAIEPYFQFWGGVDVFFVISGFVISRGLFASRQRSATQFEFFVAMVGFWIRRIWRIWPTAWFWLALSLLMSAMTRSGVWGDLLKDLESTVAVVSNVENIHQWYLYHGSAIAGGWPFNPYWSLSLEEQFYMLLPIILLTVPRRFPRYAFPAAVAIQLLLPRPVWSLLWAIRSDGLILGVLIAMSMDKPGLRSLLEPRFLAGRRVLPCLSTCGLLFLVAGVASDHVVPFSPGLIALLAGILIWYASYDADYIWPEGYLKRILVWIGSRSYAIYLIHIPTFNFTHELWFHLRPDSPPNGAATNLRFALTAAIMVALLAEANYRLLEQPLRRHGARLARDFVARHRTAAPALVDR